MLEFEQRRQALGFPMEAFSEYAGLPDRYYPKALHADRPSGRQAQWATVQIMADALYPNGFDLIIKPKPGAVMSEDNLKAKLLRLQAVKDPKCRREMMAELGRAGRAHQLANFSPEKRSAIARRAARRGWRKRRADRAARNAARAVD